MEDKVMTIQDVAKYLKLKTVTLYKHVQHGKIPGFKVGSSWRSGWVGARNCTTSVTPRPRRMSTAASPRKSAGASNRPDRKRTSQKEAG